MHIAIRWDGSTGTCFRNGIAQSASSQPDVVNMDEPMYISTSWWGSPSTFRGQLKHIKMVNFAMTDAEVSAMHTEALNQATTY